MKVCGVELKGTEAVVAIVSFEEGLYDVQHTRVPKIAIESPQCGESLAQFQFAFCKLMADYQVSKVIIKARPLKGKFAGGGVGFKLEAALQLAESIDVELIESNEIKNIVKHCPLPVDFRDVGLKQFQETAFMTAYAYLSK